MSAHGKTWMGNCTGCGREGVEVAARESHNLRVLCASCAERPYRWPSSSAAGPGMSPASSTAAAARAKPRALKLTRAADVRARPVRFLLPMRVPSGAMTLLAGEPGLGKSTWTCDLAAGVTTGCLGSTPARVLIANAEDGPDTVIKPRLAAAGADLDAVEFMEVTDDAGDRDLTLPGDLDLLSDSLAGSRASLLILDPLNAFLSAQVDGHKDQQIRRALAPLARLASEWDLAIVVTVHLNKAAGTSPLYRVGGSIGLVGGARSLLTFTRDADDPDGESGDQRLLAHSKSNWGQLAPTLVYRIDEVDLSLDGQQLTTSRLVALGESAISGLDVLSSSAGDTPATRRTQAMELLADQLGDGAEHRRRDIEDAAAKRGISASTLERAARDAGVLTERRGFPAVAFWSLPASSVITHDATGTAPVASPPVTQLANPHEHGAKPAKRRSLMTVASRRRDMTQLTLATPAEEAQADRALQLLDDTDPARQEHERDA